MGIITTLLALGFILLAYSVRLLFKRKPIKAGVNGLISLSLCSAGGILLLILLNVQTYQRLTHEIVLAEVLIGQKNHSGAPLSLKTDTLEREFLIRTEAWRLDARFLKWKPVGNSQRVSSTVLRNGSRVNGLPATVNIHRSR